ncbi:ATP-grasp enzyme [uncultured Jatrophihabitans sp.]|uniref:ATP-grasp enzyme n=1 Tax=uncultured Jatrophihabitans sp. TaxID=1610747 RepID=UPI0035CAC580
MTARPRLHRTARTLGALALLQLAAPANAALTGTVLLAGRLTRDPPPREPARRRTVLLSGGKMTKSLQLARAFHRAGHRVVLVESAAYRLTGHRFSRCVDAFHVVPKPQDPAYAQALLDVVRRENVDVYVPVCSPAASYYDALAKPLLEPHCEVLHADADVIAALDDKYRFTELARSFGLPTPDAHRIESPTQLERFDFAAAQPPYVLKSIPYDPVNRLDLTPLPRPTPQQTTAFARSKTISRDTPWIMQSLVRGQEYCTHGTARDGRLQVYACCPSSAFQVNYEMVEHPGIESWVRTFIERLGVSGQFSFDFIETADGTALPIECNPRTHSAITMFYDQTDALARAYLDDGVDTLTPTQRSRPTYWLYHELWRMISRPSTARQRAAVLARGKDAIFDLHDPLPFFVVHHVQIPALLLRNLVRGKDWIRIDFNIGKLVEPAGD